MTRWRAWSSPTAWILAEELALRDLDAERATAENYDEVMERMEQYMGEFEAHGTDHINVDLE